MMAEFCYAECRETLLLTSSDQLLFLWKL